MQTIRRRAVRQCTRWLAVFGSAWVAFTAPNVDAQPTMRSPAPSVRVTGSVIDSAGAPVAGALVVVLDEHTQLVTRALTGRGGTFQLVVPSAPSFEVRALRVGFAVSEPMPLRLDTSAPAPLTLRVSGKPTRLSGQPARQKPVCGVPRDTTSDVTHLWEEARKALAATRLPFGTESASALVVFFDRRTSRNGRSILSDEAREGSVSARQPFASLPPDSIAAHGYVIETADEVAYYAPDAEVLLSTDFSDTHCFGVQSPPSDQRGWIGLSFKPKSERPGVKEIAGTFWLDRATLELRRIEYRYTNVPPAFLATAVGGDMDVARLANGLWLISRWEIRMPQGQIQSQLDVDNLQTRTRQRVNIESLRVSGGEVRQVTVGTQVVEVRRATGAR